MASKTPPSDVLATWLPRQRWFAAKTRRLTTLAVADTIVLAGGVLAIVEVGLDDGTRDRYAVPIGNDSATAPIADALDDAAFCRGLLDLVARSGAVSGEHGEVRGVPTAAFPAGLPPLPARRVGGEQSNTSVAFGDRLIMKHFRRLADGPNPEEEMTRFLTERARFPHTPRLAGHLEYRRAGARATLAVVQELVTGARDGWEWVLSGLDAFYQDARRAPALDPARVRSLAGPTLTALERLGAVTGALHRALASDATDPAFAPEPITAADVAAWTSDVARRLASAGAALGSPSPVQEADLELGLRSLRGVDKIRHHGDLHLGQTLYREDTGEFVIIDFEGEPLRPLAERRRKHTPLRDVAGVLRSIDYAAVTTRPLGLEDWAAAWQAEGAHVITAAYRRAVSGARFVPPDDDDFARALAVLELEKAAYEVVYEANHRPAWVAIPRAGLVRAAARLGRP
ncbi:MAG: maltokinase N-terminal cap-like domain-containing protein [Candidatus Rokuibacteriota bacterium]